MTSDRYERFALTQPRYLGEEHWECIDTELKRLHRSLEAEDDSQVLGDMKCLLESIARVTLDIAGEPPEEAKNASFEKTLKRAHDLLTDQPGHQLAQGGEFRRVASSARKIACELGNVRNQFGGGHGRHRPPRIRAEMVDLVLDGGLTWARWAVRRLGLFSKGRPAQLIGELIGTTEGSWAVFRSGELTSRLSDVNLPGLVEHHQREVGVAVGQRVMQETFVVKEDGLDLCLASDDLKTWPAGYRVGLLRGLWFNPCGRPTITPQSIEHGLSVLEPVPDCADELREQVTRLCESTEPALPGQDREALQKTVKWLRDRVIVRPEVERDTLNQLINHLDPPATAVIPEES